MTTLDNVQRIRVWAGFMRDGTEPLGGMSKADLRAAVDALDDWLDAVPIKWNTAIPQPARGALSRRQKYLLLKHVLDRRLQAGA